MSRAEMVANVVLTINAVIVLGWLIVGAIVCFIEWRAYRRIWK